MKKQTAKRTRMPKDERRKQILICAVGVFAQSNYKRTRVSEIAAEVGITEAAIYKHFPSKKAIFEAILDHIHGRVITNWAAEAEKTDDALMLMKNMALLYFRKISKHPDELKVQFQAVSEAGDRDIAAKLRKHHRDYRKFIARVLAKGVEQGTIRPDVDKETIAYLFDTVGAYMNMMGVLGERAFTEKRSKKLIEQLLRQIKC